MNRNKILHIAKLTNNINSGVTHAVDGLFNGQIQSDPSVNLLNLYRTKNEKSNYLNINDFKFFEFLKFLKIHNLIIFHSNYIVENALIAKYLKFKKIPYIIIPHGGLTSKSQNIKKTKKKIGRFLLFNKFFKGASAFQFLTEMEKKESIFNTKNDFILPNGTNSTKIILDFSNTLNRNKIVFIGRLDIYTKGLDILIESITISRQFLIDNKIKVEIYGPSVEGSFEKLKDMIHKNDLNDVVNIYGPVNNKDKEEILNSALGFIQTSRFEGLPMGILEAFSYGLPCILTPGTNLTNILVDSNVGYSVEFDSTSISNGIKKLVEDRHNNNLKNKDIVELSKQFSWTKIGEESLKIYNSILDNIT